MRMPDCEDCAKLKTFKIIRKEAMKNGQPTAYLDALKEIAIKWYKHFDSKPNLMNLGSCRTLADIFDITKKDLNAK